MKKREERNNKGKENKERKRKEETVWTEEERRRNKRKEKVVEFSFKELEFLRLGFHVDFFSTFSFDISWNLKLWDLSCYSELESKRLQTWDVNFLKSLKTMLTNKIFSILVLNCKKICAHQSFLSTSSFLFSFFHYPTIYWTSFAFSIIFSLPHQWWNFTSGGNLMWKKISTWN